MKMLKEGWQLGGNKNYLTITKGERKVWFDIVILTKQGLLFTMYHKQKTAEVSAIQASRIEPKTKPNAKLLMTLCISA